jgi:hypothetical protein
MFKFDFDLDDDEIAADVLDTVPQTTNAQDVVDVPELECVEITLEELVGWMRSSQTCATAHASQGLARHPPARDLVLSAVHRV